MAGNIIEPTRLTDADLKFRNWLEANAREGATYVSPDGHLVNGTDYIRSREFVRQNTVSNAVKEEMKGISLRSLSDDTVALSTKTYVNKPFAKPIAKATHSEADKKFFEWLRMNARPEATYISPSGHMVRGADILESRKFLNKIAKNFNLENLGNFIKKAV